jgi:AraC-like DNA-binding protein
MVLTKSQKKNSHKMERINHLWRTDITEIAWKMNDSSVVHLSNQFKKIKGLSPSHFKKLKDKRRKPIEYTLYLQ